MNNTVGWPARIARFTCGLGAFAAVALAGCGGGSGTSTTVIPNSFPNAGIVIGQRDFSSFLANQGGAADANTLGNVYSSVAVDAGGTTLFVPDYSNSRVLGFAPIPTGNDPTANLVLGQADFTHTAPGSGPTQLANPGKVSVGDGGQLVVADTRNNRILIWSALPTSVNQQADLVVGPAVGSATANLSGPLAAMIANGQLFVADTGNNRVLIWNTYTTAATPVDPDFVIGQPDKTHSDINGGLNGPKGLTSPYPAAADTLNSPQDLWTDGFNLIVADTGNNRVLYYLNGFAPRTDLTIATTVNGFTAGTYSTLSATGVAGQTNFTSITGQLGQTLMNAPTAVTSNGTTVAVADSVNNRVLIFGNGLGKSSSAIPPTTIIGQENFNKSAANDDDQNGSQDNNPSQRTLNYPTGVFFSGDGTLYVTDSGNNRVLTFTSPY